jgi:Tfp pilus assembly protein PilN
VTDYKTRPAAEWGAELTSFLRSVGAAHIAATVLLPRQDVIVRTVQLPGVADKDLEAAIRLQIDSLHPFAEDDVYFSWARVGKSASVLVGVARKEVLDRLSTMFSEAGVKVASFTFSAAALYAAIRLRPVPTPVGFMVVRETDREIEIYGESEARPVFSAAFPPVGDRALGLAKSELRLEPDTQPLSFAELLPKPSVFPPNHDPATPEFNLNALPYATAVAGACPWLSIDGNLLPMEQRRASSRVRLIPTVTLASLLLLTVGGLAAQSHWADSRYLGILQHEIRRYQPQADKVAAIDTAVTTARQRTQLLDDYRRRAKYDLDALAEITKLIPPPAWVGSLDMDRQTINIAGESNDAAGLLKTLDGSALFERSEFTMPLNRTQTGEAFRIRTARSVGVGWQPKQQQAGGNSGQPGFLGGQFMEMPAAAPVVSPPPPALLPIPGSAGAPQ